MQETGFHPGGATLHSIMTPHGPDADCFNKSSSMKLSPKKVAENSMVLLSSSYLFYLIVILNIFLKVRKAKIP